MTALLTAALAIFSPWDFFMLPAVMATTNRAKKIVHKQGVSDWYIFAMPFAFAAVGVIFLVLLGAHTWSQVPALAFIFGGAGNFIFKLYRRVAGLGGDK